MRNIILLLQYCLFLSITLTCCKTTDKKHPAISHAESIAQGIPGYRFGLKLKNGDKFYFTIENDSKTSLEVNDQKKKIASNYEIGLIYEVATDTASNIVLQIKYDKIHVVVTNKNGEEEEIDADKKEDSGPFDSVNKLLAGLKGQPLTVVMTSAGNVISVKGNKEIAEKVLAGLDAKDEATQKKVQELLSQLMGDEFIKNNLSGSFKVFPDTTIFPGDTWQRKSNESASISFVTNTKYTLESMDDGIANVTVDGVIENTQGSTNLMGREVTSDINGKETGEISADTKTGMLINANIKTSLEGTVQVLGKEVPITVDLKKKISVKKL